MVSSSQFVRVLIGYNKQMTIRSANPSDTEALRQLNYEIYARNPEYDSTIISDFIFQTEGLEFIRESIQRAGGCCLIAEENGRMIGYTNGEPKSVPYRRVKMFEIDNLGVIPEYKGKGVGKALLQAITDWAKDNGYDQLYLSCYAKNEEALGFYQKNGFSTLDIGLEKNID